MILDPIVERIKDLSQTASSLAEQSRDLQVAIHEVVEKNLPQAPDLGTSPFMMGLTVFILAVFVGYYVVWKVTPALHSPLMAITNAVSSVIIVGALLAAGLPGFTFAKAMGFIAVVLASINIFGGFIVTQRMLSMFMTKKKK